MAAYYIDGTIVSASGTGSGTIGDPWGKTDDLLQYTLDQIVAGAGRGSSGDTVYITGDLNQTASIDFTGYNPQQLTPLCLRPIDSTIVDYDLGGTVFATDNNTRGLLVHLFNFHNFSNTGIAIRLSSWCGFIRCTFDGADGAHRGMLYHAGASTVIGCKFINDNRSNNLLHQCSGSGNEFHYNFYEVNNTSLYGMYIYSGTFSNNIIKVINGRNTGILLPIQGGKIINNTFIGTGNFTGSGIFMTNSYEDQVIVNNYFEGLYRPLNANISHNAQVQYLVGNKAYNNTTNTLPTNTEAVVYDYDNDWALSSTGLTDAASGDYRPNETLKGVGVNLYAWTQAQSYTVAPSVGAMLPVSTGGEAAPTSPIFPRTS